MRINNIALTIHKNAVDHGWWEEERSAGEIISLCHAELSEALEAYRNGEELVWINDGKPDGIAVELIDCVIRIFDALEYCSVHIEQEINKIGYQGDIKTIAADVHKQLLDSKLMLCIKSPGDMINVLHTLLASGWSNPYQTEWVDYNTEAMIYCTLIIFGYLDGEGVDIEHTISLKHKYNTTRPYKHGGKKI